MLDVRATATVTYEVNGGIKANSPNIYSETRISYAKIE